MLAISLQVTNYIRFKYFRDNKKFNSCLQYANTSLTKTDIHQLASQIHVKLVHVQYTKPFRSF